MQKRRKKAACIAAFGYCSVLILGMGMLRTAQQTRRTLYGGVPVLAQITHPPQSGETAVSLGGGEWELHISMPEYHSALSQTADALPPSAEKLLLRLFLLSDSAADYTVEWISGA